MTNNQAFIAGYFQAKGTKMSTELVERAIARLRHNIAKREATEDVEALKTVLLELDAQKQRADRLSASLATMTKVREERDEAREQAYSFVAAKLRAEIKRLDYPKSMFPQEAGTIAKRQQAFTIAARYLEGD